MEGNLFHHRPVSLMSPHRPGRLSTVPIHLHERGRSSRTANRARMLFFSSSFLHHGPTRCSSSHFRGIDLCTQRRRTCAAQGGPAYKTEL